MNRDYTTRADNEDTYAVLERDGLYIEVLLDGDEVSTQDRLDQALMLHALDNMEHCLMRDDVYIDKNIIRQDYSIATVQGLEIVKELEAHFPDYLDFKRSDFNVIGKYDGYREPYTNDSISWYDFGVSPSESLQLEFSASYPTADLKRWYGLKFDLVTKEVIFKAVINNYDGETPELPNGITFYAVSHHQDGSTSDWVDSYVYATPKRIREFCHSKGLAYPLPADTHEQCDVVWCWGVVFNKTTLEYGVVKAYCRYNLD